MEVVWRELAQLRLELRQAIGYRGGTTAR